MGDVGATRHNAPESEPMIHGTKLAAGSLSLAEVLMQGVTHIAPAFGLFFSFQFIAQLAGITAPLAFLIGAAIMILLGVSLGSMAKFVPSAGGYFTYVSKAVHPRVGFLISWLYVLYSPITAGLVFGIVGVISDNYFKAQYGFQIAWYWWVLAGLLFVSAISYRGIKIAGRLLLITGLAEIAILLALSIAGLSAPGHGGINLSSFNPGNSMSGNGLYLAIVFSITAYTGWESVAPLAEETRNPTRAIPRAMVWSVVLMAVVWCFVTWGVLVGWGTSHVASFASSVENPMLVLGSRLWGAGSIFILVALWNSALAVGLALFNITTRMWYGMARAGALPHALTRIHKRYKTPVGTITLTLVLNVAIAIGLGLAYGSSNAFFLYAFCLSFALVFIYSAGNIAVYLFFHRQRPGDFNPWLHLIFPVISTLALIWVEYKSTIPLPAAPIGYGAYVFGVWFVLGGVVLIVMRLRGREEWLIKAGEIVELGPDGMPAPLPPDDDAFRL